MPAAEVWRFDVDHQAEVVGEQIISSGDEIAPSAQSITLYVFPQH